MPIRECDRTVDLVEYSHQPPGDEMAYILIVGNDPTTRSVLRTLLKDVGHDLGAADDGLDGLRSMGRRLPDLVITELYMDGMEGMEFLRRVRATWPEQRVIVMTSLDRVDAPDVLKTARFLGATGYLDKPLVERRVLGTVGVILDAGEVA